jgi:hypothetical protein
MINVSSRQRWYENPGRPTVRLGRVWWWAVRSVGFVQERLVDKDADCALLGQVFPRLGAPAPVQSCVLGRSGRLMISW